LIYLFIAIVVGVIDVDKKAADWATSTGKNQRLFESAQEAGSRGHSKRRKMHSTHAHILTHALVVLFA